MEKIKLTRDVTPDECGWLDRTYKKGEILYEYHGCTYGCISNNGTACTETPNQTPFFEIPNNAILNTQT